jgi:biotin synthase
MSSGHQTEPETNRNPHILSLLQLTLMLRVTSSIPLSLLTRSLATHAASTSAAPARHDWTKEEVKRVFDTSLIELVFRAASVHRRHHDPSKIQLCSLINIKSEY